VSSFQIKNVYQAKRLQIVAQNPEGFCEIMAESRNRSNALHLPARGGLSTLSYFISAAMNLPWFHHRHNNDNSPLPSFHFIE
jgi:hypothetical protein